MTSWRSEHLDNATTKVNVRWNGASTDVGAALELCRTDDRFRSQLMGVLAECPFSAYFWELPPITTSSLTRPFEFVLSEARGLANASPDVNAFREYFDSDDDHDGIVVLQNLGRDATLVVPCPLTSAGAYVHLAAFLRAAPESQRHALFRSVATELLSRVSDRPLWLSTAGMGVFWLHVRIDSRPKYYRHTPYKQP